jgi:hypothetical protein
MAQLEVQPGSNITVTINKGPLSGGVPAGNIGDLQYNVDGKRFGNVAPVRYDPANLFLTFGEVGNVALSGGTAGQVVTNTGDGTLSWQTLSNISNTTTSINVNASNIQLSAGNEANLATITETELTYRGNILPEANVTYDLGSPTQRWRDLYLSNATIDMNGVRLSSDGTDIITHGGMIVKGGIVTQEFFGNISGDYIRGDGSLLYNINGANVIGSVGVSITSGIANAVTDSDQPNITSLGTLTGLSVSGVTDLGDVGNVKISGGSAGNVLITNGGGDLSFGTIVVDKIVSENTSIIAKNNAINVEVGGTSIIDMNGAAITVRTPINSTGNVVTTGKVGANTITANAITTGNITANGRVTLNQISNVKLQGGNSGEFIRTDGQGNIVFATPDKIVSGLSKVDFVNNSYVKFQVSSIANALVVKETGLELLGDANSYMGNVVRANYFVGNTIVGDHYNLGNVGNVTLLGGTSNSVLRTDGNGNLSFYYIDETLVRDSNGGNSNVRTTSSGVKISADGVANVVTVRKDGIEGRVDIIGNTHIGGTIFTNAGNINGELDVLGDANIGGNLSVGSNANVRIGGGTNNQVLTTNGSGNLSWTTLSTVSASNTITGNTSSVTIFPDGNIGVEVNGTANVALFNNGGLSLDGYLETTSRVYPESVEFANIANLVIPGGSNGQVLSTNGSGVLQWKSTAAANAIVNGTSNVNISSANGNVAFSVGGTTNTAVFSNAVTTFNTDLVVTGNLDIQGNITYIESNTVNINDKNITLANAAANSVQADGGGFTIAGANATFVYTNSSNSFTSSHSIAAPVFTGIHRGASQDLVVNKSGGALVIGDAVYISGAQGQRIAVAKASNASEGLSAGTIGIIAIGGADNSECYVQYHGVLSGVNTGGLTEGAPVFLGATAGTWTTTEPISPAHLVVIGFIQRAHASQGEIYIDVNNFQELAECSDVLLPANVANISNRAILSFDSANSLWIDGTLDMGTY